MLVIPDLNRDLLVRSVRAGVHAATRRWLPFVVHSPVPRGPLLAVTALTAAAAVAGSTTVPASAPSDRLSALGSAHAAAGPAEPGTGGANAGGSAADRAAKPRAAKQNEAKQNAAKRNAAKQKGAPSDQELMPRGTPGGQSAFAPSREQVDNAKKIVRTGERLKMPPRAQVVAVATALQESKLENLGHLGARNDHDSLGLFQQRPSTGWGTPEQVTDPDYAAEQFYRGLARDPGYQDRPLAEAAQAVQVSAFPDAYAQWEKMASDLVLAAHDAGPYANQ